MATLSNPTYFAEGVAEDEQHYHPYVGYYNYTNYVVRYDLTLDNEENASHIKVVFDGSDSGDISFGPGVGEGLEDIFERKKLFFIISTSPTEFVNAGYFDKDKAMGQLVMTHIYDDAVKAECEVDMYLYSGVDYYLYVFPGFRNADMGGDGNYGTWLWDRQLDITVELSGSAGLVYIDNGTTVDAYIPYIDNGTSWDICIPYIDNGTSWDICG